MGYKLPKLFQKIIEDEKKIQDAFSQKVIDINDGREALEKTRKLRSYNRRSAERFIQRQRGGNA